jgi:hypothetical protein
VVAPTGWLSAADPTRRSQIIDEPIPETCYARNHADYDGQAVRWGLGNKVRSAAECCRQCQEFKVDASNKYHCNVWVWCGDPSGECWTADIHKHTTGGWRPGARGARWTADIQQRGPTSAAASQRSSPASPAGPARAAQPSPRPVQHARRPGLRTVASHA